MKGGLLHGLDFIRKDKIGVRIGTILLSSIWIGGMKIHQSCIFGGVLIRNQKEMAFKELSRGFNKD